MKNIRKTLILCAIASCLGNNTVIDAEELAVPELIRNLKGVETALLPFSLKCEIEVEDCLGLSTSRLTSEDAFFLLDSNGRAFTQTTEYSSGSDKKRLKIISKRMGAYDGACMKKMEGGATFDTGSVFLERTYLPWRIDPCNFATNFFDKPVSEWLSKRSGQIVGETLWEGTPVILVETDVEETCGLFQKLQFWIDTKKGFAVVKKLGLLQYPPDEKWVEYARIAGYEYSKIGPKVWLPNRVIYEELDSPRATSQDEPKGPKLIKKWTVTSPVWNIQSSIKDDSFTLQFPPELHIYVDPAVTNKNLILWGKVALVGIVLSGIAITWLKPNALASFIPRRI